VGAEPVFLILTSNVVGLVITADWISSFSNLVKTPTSPEAQKATAIAITIATATNITVATTGLIPDFFLPFTRYQRYIQ
jgi:hypothetical protein